MISFKRLSYFDHFKRMWPPYRRRKDAELKEAIRYLVQHPEAPCMINDIGIIPNGFGRLSDLSNLNTDGSDLWRL